MMMNTEYIFSEYEHRSLTSLLVEYARLTYYVESICDCDDKFIDDDSLYRLECVKDVICNRLLKKYNYFVTGQYYSFEYYMDGLSSSAASEPFSADGGTEGRGGDPSTEYGSDGSPQSLILDNSNT